MRSRRDSSLLVFARRLAVLGAEQAKSETPSLLQSYTAPVVQASTILSLPCTRRDVFVLNLQSTSEYAHFVPLWIHNLAAHGPRSSWLCFNPNLMLLRGGLEKFRCVVSSVIIPNARQLVACCAKPNALVAQMIRVPFVAFHLPISLCFSMPITIYLDSLWRFS